MTGNQSREVPYDRGAWSPEEVEKIILTRFRYPESVSYIGKLHDSFRSAADPIYAKLESLWYEMVEGYGRKSEYGDAFFIGAVFGLETVNLLDPASLPEVDEQLRTSLNLIHEMVDNQDDIPIRDSVYLPSSQREYVRNISDEGDYRLRRVETPLRRLIESVKAELQYSNQEKALLGRGFGFMLGQLEKVHDIHAAEEEVRNLSDNDFNREIARILFENYDSDAA